MILCLCSFSDVPKSYWGYDEIKKAYDLGIIKGYTDQGFKGTFGPDDATTKEQLSIMLYRVMAAGGQLKTSEDLSEKHIDELVASKVSDWAYKEVAYGFEYGIWTPEDFQEKSAFGGAAKVGRLMIARWLCNAAELPQSTIRIIEYSDVSGMYSSYGYLDALYRYDIMHGSDGQFSPKKDTSRAEASAVCVRLNQRSIPVGSNLNSELICLYGTFSNFDNNNYSFCYTSGDITKNIQIDSNATIILNGKKASFSDIAALAGTKMMISTVAGDANVIIAHNSVSSFSGKEALVTKCEKRQAYTYLEVLIDDLVIPFCITNNTSIYGGTIQLGSKLNIFCDGCELIEVKVL